MTEQNNETPEQRFARLFAQIKEMGADLRVSLVIGGIRVDRLYTIHEDADDPKDLNGQLDVIEELVQDDRTQALINADARLTEIDAIIREVNEAQEIRMSEWRIARNAMRQITDAKPEKGDLRTYGLAVLARSVADDARDRARSLAEAANLSQKHPDNETDSA